MRQLCFWALNYLDLHKCVSGHGVLSLFHVFSFFLKIVGKTGTQITDNDQSIGLNVLGWFYCCSVLNACQWDVRSYTLYLSCMLKCHICVCKCAFIDEAS